MKYVVEVDRGEPGQIAYGAIVPALPGCFAVGNTLDELLANLMEVTSLWIETAREDGDTSHPMPTGFIINVEVHA